MVVSSRSDLSNSYMYVMWLWMSHNLVTDFYQVFVFLIYVFEFLFTSITESSHNRYTLYFEVNQISFFVKCSNKFIFLEFLIAHTKSQLNMKQIWCMFCCCAIFQLADTCGCNWTLNNYSVLYFGAVFNLTTGNLLNIL